MVTELDKLRADLVRVETKIAELSAECERTGGAATNPEGDIGGIRSRSRRQKDRILDRWDQQSRDWRRLTEERYTLRARIRWAEGATGRARAQMAKLLWWDSLAAGDQLWPDGGPTIAKMNRGSAITTNGTRWTCQEMTGLSPARVAELRAELDLAAQETAA